LPLQHVSLLTFVIGVHHSFILKSCCGRSLTAFRIQFLELEWSKWLSVETCLSSNVSERLFNFTLGKVNHVPHILLQVQRFGFEKPEMMFLHYFHNSRILPNQRFHKNAKFWILHDWKARTFFLFKVKYWIKISFWHQLTQKNVSFLAFYIRSTFVRDSVAFLTYF